MRATRLIIAKADIEDFFRNSPVKVFRKIHLSNILASYREEWNLPAGLTFSRFLDFLLSECGLREIILESEHYASERRFVWGDPSVCAVAVSLRNRSYLTHLSAMFLHGLTDESPAAIYVNHEQSPKPRGGALTQEGIDRAFANRQRQSNLSFRYGETQIVVVNGKFTGRLGVTPLPSPDGESLDATNLERTLIDIAVRPAYAGGVGHVLEAYRKAKGRASATGLVETLRNLDYVYPYHQVIGFYMERAGYPKSKWSRLLGLGADFDFYLANQLPDGRKYDPKWRVFYPGTL